MNLKALNSQDHVDEFVPEISTDNTSKTKSKRTRLRILFEEFQDEIDFLEEKFERCSAENAKLKVENEALRQQLDNGAVLCKETASEHINGSKVNRDITTTSDISTIIKLSNKLQEMIHVNENIMRVNTALRKDLKSLMNERDSHLRDTAQSKGKISRIQPVYDGWNLMALESNINSYKHEIDHRKNAQKPLDNFITGFDKDIKQAKLTDSMNKMSVPIGLNMCNNLSRTSASSNQVICSPINQSESRSKNVGVSTNNSAKEVLQILVSRIDSTQNESFVSNPPSKEGDENAKNPGNAVNDASDQLSSSTISSKQNDVNKPMSPLRNDNSEELFSDPFRFPACVRLLELTKARQSDISSKTVFSSNNGNEMSSPLASNYRGSPSVRTSGCATNLSIASNCALPNMVDPENKGEIEDDITIVLPSTDHSLVNQVSQSTESDREPDIYHLSTFCNTNSHIHSQSKSLLPASDDHISAVVKSREGVVVSTGITDYPHYTASLDPHNFCPPMKKIKVEDTYK